MPSPPAHGRQTCSSAHSSAARALCGSRQWHLQVPRLGQRCCARRRPYDGSLGRTWAYELSCHVRGAAAKGTALTCVADRAHVKRDEKRLGEEGVQRADCAGAPDGLAHGAVRREHPWGRRRTALVGAERLLEQLLDALDLACLLRLFPRPRRCELLLLLLVSRLRPPPLPSVAPDERQRPRHHGACARTRRAPPGCRAPDGLTVPRLRALHLPHLSLFSTAFVSRTGC